MNERAWVITSVNAASWRANARRSRRAVRGASAVAVLLAQGRTRMAGAPAVRRALAHSAARRTRLEAHIPCVRACVRACARACVRSYVSAPAQAPQRLRRLRRAGSKGLPSLSAAHCPRGQAPAQPSVKRPCRPCAQERTTTAQPSGLIGRSASCATAPHTRATAARAWILGVAALIRIGREPQYWPCTSHGIHTAWYRVPHERARVRVRTSAWARMRACVRAHARVGSCGCLRFHPVRHMLITTGTVDG